MVETLKIVKNAQDNLYDSCNLQIENFTPENEGTEYYAHSCSLKNKNIKFRIAKKTPTKIGWFVTIWKRGPDGIIAPYDESDLIDFVIISILDNTRMGQFIFPKSILLKRDIFSTKTRGGKRAIRVYAPWDKTISSQALKTQKWQEQYFFDLTSKNAKNIENIKLLYSM